MIVGHCPYNITPYICMHRRMHRGGAYIMSKTTEHKEGKATVKVFYKMGKTLADGSHPFQIRITKNRVQTCRSIGLSLHPKYWNAEKSGYRDAIRKSYPEKSREALINELERWEKKYKEAADTKASEDEPHTADEVLKKAIEGRKAARRVKLLAYCTELSEGYKKIGKEGNATIYRDLRNQLAKFVAAEADAPTPPTGRGQDEAWATWMERYDIPLDRANTVFCQEWEQTLRATGIKETTLSLRFRTLRALLNQAIAAGLMKETAYPFARTVAEKHKMQVGKFDVSTTKRAIPRDTIRRLEALTLTTDRLQLAKDVFMFSFYCGGINFVDLGQLRWRNLSDTITGTQQRMSYVRQKTGGKFSVGVMTPMAAILAHYKPLTFATLDSYIFPILDANLHQTPKQVKNRLHKVLGQVNKDLKKLGEMLGITTALTTYVARHSFATSLKLNGQAVGVISQALGHRDEATTAVYLDSFGSELVDSAYASLLE